METLEFIIQMEKLKKMVNEIINKVKIDNILWEAPKQTQQAWLINKFGPHVNLEILDTKIFYL